MVRLSQRRPSAAERGYDWRWEKASRLFRSLHPLCLGCEAIGRIEPATLVDHIEPHQGDALKFWDEANWQPCCDWHHNAIKAELERQWFAGLISRPDLRLDSEAAKHLSRQTPRRPIAFGSDGWGRG